MGKECYDYTGEVSMRLLGLGAVSIGQDTYVSDVTRTYIAITLLHSFPKVNLNGATLLPPLLAKIIPTADNQPLNVDHQMEGNPPEVYQGTDLVVGSMIKAYLSTDEISLFPAEPVAAKVIGVLWNRVTLAREIINSIGQGEKQYRISFEIPRDLDEDGWVVLGENGPSYEAEISKELLEAWQRKEYDKVALAVGGDGSGNSANIYGGGFTLIPADKDAKITAILTGSIKGQTAIAARIDPTYASVIPYKKFPKAPIETSWSFSAADGNALLGEDGDNWARYRSVYTVYDSDNPEKKASYKLPVAKEFDGTIKVVWRGVAAAMGRTLQKGTKLSDTERKGAYARLKKYYKDFDKEVPEYGSYTDAQLAAMGFDMAAVASYMESNNEEGTTMLKPAIAQGGFSVQVSGGQIVLTLGENVINQPDDFYLGGYKRHDGEYVVHASMEIAKGGIDGFKEKVRLEYDPTADGDGLLTPVEEGSEKVKTPLMYEAQISALMATIKEGSKAEDKVRAIFADFISPDDHQAGIDAAVVKALADAGSDNLFTEEQLNNKVQESIKEILETRDAAEAIAKIRGDKLVKEGLVLTAERKIHIATIAVGDEGDVAFTKWLASLEANQKTMAEDLKSANIEVTDQVKAALANLNSKEDSGFAALVAAYGATPAFTPSMSASGGETGSGPNPAEGAF